MLLVVRRFVSSAHRLLLPMLRMSSHCAGMMSERSEMTLTFQCQDFVPSGTNINPSFFASMPRSMQIKILNLYSSTNQSVYTNLFPFSIMNELRKRIGIAIVSLGALAVLAARSLYQMNMSAKDELTSPIMYHHEDQHIPDRFLETQEFEEHGGSGAGAIEVEYEEICK